MAALATGFKRSQSPAVNRPVLAPDKSARLREGMLAEIETIASDSAATAWANTMLQAKNTLTADDARSVESAFETKIAGLTTDGTTEPASLLTAQTEREVLVAQHRTAESSQETNGTRSERNPPIIKTVRHRNKEHLQFVAAQPCLICAKQPADPHHLCFAQPRALGRKVSDRYTVPLCRAHHREVHRAAKEIVWWQSVGVAPLGVAEALWQKSQSGHALNAPRTMPHQRIANRNSHALEKPDVR